MFFLFFHWIMNMQKKKRKKKKQYTINRLYKFYFNLTYLKCLYLAFSIIFAQHHRVNKKQDRIHSHMIFNN